LVSLRDFQIGYGIPPVASKNDDVAAKSGSCSSDDLRVPTSDSPKYTDSKKTVVLSVTPNVNVSSLYPTSICTTATSTTVQLLSHISSPRGAYMVPQIYRNGSRIYGKRRAGQNVRKPGQSHHRYSSRSLIPRNLCRRRLWMLGVAVASLQTRE